MNTIDALYIVKHNPFKYAEYIYSFYHSLGSIKNNLLLSYLVIPICSHPVFSKKIKNMRPKISSLYTIFNNRNDLYDLQERIEYLKELTSESIRYCLINDLIEIDFEELSIYTNPVDLNPHKISNNFGILLKNYSVEEIYLYLGVNL